MQDTVTGTTRRWSPHWPQLRGCNPPAACR